MKNNSNKWKWKIKIGKQKSWRNKNRTKNQNRSLFPLNNTNRICQTNDSLRAPIILENKPQRIVETKMGKKKQNGGVSKCLQFHQFFQPF